MGYESDPSGIGVAQEYGPRDIGDVNGAYKNYGTDQEKVFEFTSKTSEGATTAIKRYAANLPANYRVDGIELVVTEVFASSSTVDIEVGAGASLTTNPILTALGRVTVSLAGLGNVTSTDSEEVVMILNSNAIASATGHAKLVLKYSIVK